jgi:adenylate cyclase class IV
MIEIEYKFILDLNQKEMILTNAIFQKEENFTDRYFDLPDYTLSLQDIWLSTRNEAFRLKVPTGQSGHQEFTTQKNNPKKEIHLEKEIKQFFKINGNGALESSLEEIGIKPFYSFNNIRRKYLKDGLTIDIDTAFEGDFCYELCEVELEVESKQEIKAAIEKLEDFMRVHELEIKPVNGKLIELIRLRNDIHYNLLSNSSNYSK